MLTCLPPITSVSGRLVLKEGSQSISGIGLMMAKALENNGATVYIVGRRQNVLEKAAEDNNVNFYRLDRSWLMRPDSFFVEIWKYHPACRRRYVPKIITRCYRTGRETVGLCGCTS